MPLTMLNAAVPPGYPTAVGNSAYAPPVVPEALPTPRASPEKEKKRKKGGEKYVALGEVRLKPWTP